MIETNVVFTKLKEYLKTSVMLDREQYELAAAWVMMTWVHQQMNVVPVLAIIGWEPGIGKSHLSKVLSHVCYESIFAHKMSLSAMMELAGGRTVIIEEYVLSEWDRNAIVGTKDVVRAIEGEDEGFEVKAFNVFGPKIYVGRERFKDNSLNSRCKFIEMKIRSPFDLYAFAGFSFATMAQDVMPWLAEWAHSFSFSEGRADFDTFYHDLLQGAVK